MKKLKVGVVGIGGMGRNTHLPAFGAMPDVEVAAVCDVNPAKMDIEGLENVQKYTDYKRMVDEADIDAVDICTPNYLHSPIAVYALNGGKHVFCEKPDAVSLAERKKMSEAERKSGKTLMVMRNNRHLPTTEYLKTLIDSGECGKFYTGRCGWIRRRGIPGKGGWFTTKEKSGGGPLIDLGVHMLDLAVYLMGDPRAVSVSGNTYRKFADAADISDSVHSAFGEKMENGVFDVEDLATGFVRFDNGATLQLEFSWASNIEKEKRFVELRGEKCGFTWQDETLKIFTEKNGQLVDEDVKAPFGDGHRANLRHFVDVVLHGAKSDFSSCQGENMVAIIEAIYKSAAAGKEILL